MATIQVTERNIGKTAEYTQTGRSYTRVFYVKFSSVDSSTDWFSTVIAAVDPTYGTTIPAVGDSHPDDNRAIVRKVTPRMLGDKGDAYEVVVSYDTQSDFAGFNGTDVTFIENPINRAPTISWTFEKIPEALYHAFGKMEGVENEDWSSKTWTTASGTTITNNQATLSVPVRNTKGQLFDPPLVKDAHTIVGVLTRNELLWDGAQALEYQDTVNNDTWLGFNPGQVRMHSISAERIWESGIWYYRVRYEVHIRKHWYRIVPNDGYIDGEIVNFNPNLVSGSNPQGITPSGDPKYLIAYKIYEEKPFDLLNLE